MGSFSIERLSPLIQCRLLIRKGPAFDFAADIPVQAFMTSIVLGATRSPAFQVDSQNHPPG